LPLSRKLAGAFLVTTTVRKGVVAMASKSNKYRKDVIPVNTNGSPHACDAPKMESRGRGNQGGLAKTTVRYRTTKEHDAWNAAVNAKKREKFRHRLNKKYGI
jgi:hypothetical protein